MLYFIQTQSRIKIQGDDRFLADASRFRDSRPAYNRGDADPSFVQHSFSAFEWSIRGHIPCEQIEGMIPTQPAVVGREDHHRILRKFQFVQRVQNSPHAVIEAVNHRCIRGVVMLIARLLLLVFVNQRLLGLNGGVDSVRISAKSTFNLTLSS